VPLNVLIVDDSAIMRQMVIKALTLTGVSIGELHQAANGSEGLAIVEKHWVDLVLVDINMPVMNGQEMIERLRARSESESLPIVVVSTDGSQARIEMMNRHHADFVQKPFTPETLREVIIRATGATYDELAGSGTAPGDGPDF
jgi:two-component system, chemotaxis family, chemotaxis protein CheY